MIRTIAVKVRRHFRDYQIAARRAPIEITRHGRSELVLMSADHYDWLVAAVRRTHITSDAAVVIVDAVERATVRRLR